MSLKTTSDLLQVGLQIGWAGLGQTLSNFGGGSLFKPVTKPVGIEQAFLAWFQTHAHTYRQPTFNVKEAIDDPQPSYDMIIWMLRCRILLL